MYMCESLSVSHDRNALSLIWYFLNKDKRLKKFDESSSFKEDSLSLQKSFPVWPTFLVGKCVELNNSYSEISQDHIYMLIKIYRSITNTMIRSLDNLEWWKLRFWKFRDEWWPMWGVAGCCRTLQYQISLIFHNRFGSFSCHQIILGLRFDYDL